jgi:mono/diheme cytochrome c family protein
MEPPNKTAQSAKVTRPPVRRGIVALIIIVGLAVTLFLYASRKPFRPAVSPNASASPLDVPAAPPVASPDNVVSLERGLAVYGANCAACHGASGLGDGPAVQPPDPAPPMLPKPRDFSSGAFKIGTTRTGLPTDDDLAATIRHGMLPAAMPPWPQLTDADVKSVVIAVRHLAIQAHVAAKLKRDPACSREKALQNAHAQLDPGPLIVLPPRPVTIDLDRGRVFYTANCAACHDPDGRGKLRTDLVDNDENPISPRDFTSPMFKGGTRIEDIAMRIVRGIPGSPMPANADIAAADLWSTAAYVKTFAQQGTMEAR